MAVLHSAMSPGERYDEWRRLRSGEASVCVGPRSAVFAPVRDLGLVVIDEEHDPSYKQEGDPRYDARAVARKRAADRGAVLLAGSATPGPRAGSPYRASTCPGVSTGWRCRPWAWWTCVGLTPLRAASAETLDALEEVREAGEKAIVLINRRGFAPWLTCRSCGRHWDCPNCDVSLITHRRGGRLVCHHCAHAEPCRAPARIAARSASRAGAGTERIEELLARRLAPMTVLRLDSDSAAGRGAHARILGAFEAAPSAVLVGTQMVAKGHDFPEVTLSVILDADATLRFPDFRAEERTFAMVAQLAGRSGRGTAGGEVIVQTLAPEAPSIAHARDHDTAGFIAGELERRRALAYPPYSHLIRIGLASEAEPPLSTAAERLRDAVAGAVPPDTEVLGPAPMFRVRGRHRRRLLLKTADRGATVEAVREAVERMAGERALRRVAIGVDVDPQ